MTNYLFTLFFQWKVICQAVNVHAFRFLISSHEQKKWICHFVYSGSLSLFFHCFAACKELIVPYILQVPLIIPEPLCLPHLRSITQQLLSWKTCGGEDNFVSLFCSFSCFKRMKANLKHSQTSFCPLHL